MSHLLIPVDFTTICHNAYRYGLQLADEMGLDVVLAHYYSGSIEAGQPLVITGDGSIEGSFLERLRQFAQAEGKQYPRAVVPEGVSVSYEADVSLSASAAIIRRAQREDISMVVMPPRASKAVLGQWLGSTATTVSEACDRPVLLVPPEADYRPFDRIVVANNHNTADPYPLWQLEGLADLYGSKVNFVHVEWPNQWQAFRFIPWRLMEELVDREPGVSYPFEVVTVEREDVSDGLLDYAEEADADLIVIVNRLRSRWRSLLRASLTQDLALRTHLPLLVLHTEVEESNDAPLPAYSPKAEI